LRRETRTVTVAGAGDEEFMLEQKSPDEYKAIVTFALGAEKLGPYWVYFQPRLEVKPTRTTFSLEGGDWTVKALETNNPTTFPIDNSNARPTYVPGIQRGTWEWYQWKVRQMILRKTFTLPQEMQNNRRLLLEIGDVRQTADVYINGQSVGRVNFNEIPKQLDISKAVNRQGENEIVVVLGDAETMAEALNLTVAKKTFSNGAFRRSMILGTTKIHAVPEVRVLRTWINTSVANKKLSVKTYIENASTQPATVDVNGEVWLKDKQVFALTPQKVTVPAGQTSVVTVERPWADPQMYSPWSPTLYGFKTTATFNGQTADQKIDRFGFRELTMQGDQILLNGVPFHGIGHEYRSDGSSEAWPMLDFHREANQLRDIKALGYTYLRRGKIEPQIHDLQDEVGIFTSLHYGPWDNGQGDVGTDDETVALYTKEPVTNIPEIVNHPSIYMYNYGNEVYHGGNKSEKLALSMYEVVKRIKQTDPTRPIMTQGSDDLDGRADVIGAHYWNYVYPVFRWTNPAELRERTTAF
jgi:beta-galactosidase